MRDGQLTICSIATVEGSCTVKNVWWEDVCEDALTLHQQAGTSQVIGGGARYAEDKIIQHDGCGEVVIQDFYADTFGKVYRLVLPLALSSSYPRPVISSSFSFLLFSFFAFCFSSA